MRIVVNKHWRVYVDFGLAGIILNLTRITANVVNSLALPTVPVYKKNRIALLLCIFETSILQKDKNSDQNIDHKLGLF